MMRTIQTVGTVTPERKVTNQLPPEIEPGEHKLVVVVEERKDEKTEKAEHSLLDFPVHDFGPWPEGISLRREDMYGDDGR